ncbi:unnamed protein product, partial [Mesorhabditis spiculigera]
MIWLKPWLGLPIVAVAFLLANAQKCAICPDGGAWTDWELIGECSWNCGYKGSQNQSRNCVSNPYGCPCDGPSTRQIPCNNTICEFPNQTCADGYWKSGPENGVYICSPIVPPVPDPLESQMPNPDWMCSEFVTTTTTTTTAKPIRPSANGSLCANCPDGGAWTDWEEVGECSGFCGYMGRQNETRNCVSEPWGCPCDGPSSRLIPCNRTICLFPLHECAAGYKVGGPIDKMWVCVPIDPPTPDPLESQVPDPDWECTEFDHDHDFYYHYFNDDDYDNHDNNYYEYDYYHYYDDDHDHDDHDYDDINEYDYNYNFNYYDDYDNNNDNNEYDYCDDVDQYYYNNHHYDDDYHDDHDHHHDDNDDHDDHDDHEDHDDHVDYYHYDNDDDEDNYDHNNNNNYYYYDYFNEPDNYEKTLLPDHVRTRADVEGVIGARKRRSQDPALEENCYNPYNTTIQCTANMNLMATQRLYDKDRNVVRTLNYCTGANKAAAIYCQRASGNSDNYFILQQVQKSIGYFSCDVAWSAECA